LGPDHADVATSLENLAALHYAQGRYTEAQPLFERALAIMERMLGRQHEKTIAVRQALSDVVEGVATARLSIERGC
jgi:hypothetical protein